MSVQAPRRGQEDVFRGSSDIDGHLFRRERLQHLAEGAAEGVGTSAPAPTSPPEPPAPARNACATGSPFAMVAVLEGSAVLDGSLGRHPEPVPPVALVLAAARLRNLKVCPPAPIWPSYPTITRYLVARLEPPSTTAKLHS